MSDGLRTRSPGCHRRDGSVAALGWWTLPVAVENEIPGRQDAPGAAAASVPRGTCPSQKASPACVPSKDRRALLQHQCTKWFQQSLWGTARGKVLCTSTMRDAPGDAPDTPRLHPASLRSGHAAPVRVCRQPRGPAHPGPHGHLPQPTPAPQTAPVLPAAPTHARPWTPLQARCGLGLGETWVLAAAWSLLCVKGMTIACSGGGRRGGLVHSR